MIECKNLKNCKTAKRIHLTIKNSKGRDRKMKQIIKEEDIFYIDVKMIKIVRQKKVMCR